MAAGEKRGRRRRRPPRRRARSARARARRRRAAWRWCPKPSRARARASGVPNGERLLAVERPLGEGGAHPSRTSAAMGDA